MFFIARITTRCFMVTLIGKSPVWPLNLANFRASSLRRAPIRNHHEANHEVENALSPAAGAGQGSLGTWSANKCNASMVAVSPLGALVLGSPFRFIESKYLESH